MTASSQTTIDHPDGNSIAPAAGQLYVQSGTLGVIVQNPGGQALVWQSSDVQGGGPVSIEQQGRRSRYGSGDAATQQSMVWSPNFQVLSSGGQALGAPDISIDLDSGGLTSYARVAATADGLDWTGGVPVVLDPTGQRAVGAVWRGLNVSGGGQRINIPDANAGGWARVGEACIVWGYLETVEFTLDTFGWVLTLHTGSYGSEGGYGRGGARILRTASTATAPLYKMVAGNTITNGIGFRGDVSVTGPGGALYEWWGVTAAWDGANALFLPMTVDRQGGNAAAVALGFTGAELSLATAVGGVNGFNELQVTPPTASALVWDVRNVRHLAGSF